MINTSMGVYEFYRYNVEDEYGQPILSEIPEGTIKIAIFNIAKSVQDGVSYATEEYIGLTSDKAINDTYIIQYGDIKLKVLYVIPAPRLKVQVFMSRM
ncbi:MAG: hypothetical protein II309_06050 [Bacilli bacterium]|nr:hypothetical protein [Bacilli bacterium]